MLRVMYTRTYNNVLVQYLRPIVFDGDDAHDGGGILVARVGRIQVCDHEDGLGLANACALKVLPVARRTRQHRQTRLVLQEEGAHLEVRRLLQQTHDRQALRALLAVHAIQVAAEVTVHIHIGERELVPTRMHI